ncbi:MAG: hypothetical protein KC613_17050 [Myxococcales bacterium]|nr:hypothetical protein [Myxococcales bacterium]MCB9522829.1 hypothetical protein [Myxococcales bacterium]
MSTKNTRADRAQPTAEGGPAPKAKRPYEKPGFVTSLAFERGSLACGSNLMNAAPPFGSCALQS